MREILCVLLVCSLCVLSGCGRASEEAEVEAAFARYVQAFDSGDSDALKASTTEEMYPRALLALGVTKDLGLSIEHVSHAVDKIEGDNAYLNAECKVKGITSHERVVLKRHEGKWLVAGKQ